MSIEDSAAAGAASKEEPVDGGDNKQAFWSVRESEKDNTILIATRIKCDTEVTHKFLQTCVLTDTMTGDRRVMSRKSHTTERITLDWSGDPYAGTSKPRIRGNLVFGQGIEMVNAVTSKFVKIRGAEEDTFTVQGVDYEEEGEFKVLTIHDTNDGECGKWLKLLELAKEENGLLKKVTRTMDESTKKKASKEATRDSDDGADDADFENDIERLKKGTKKTQQKFKTFSLYSADGKTHIGHIEYQHNSSNDIFTNINATLTISKRYVSTEQNIFFQFTEIGDSSSESSASSEDGDKRGGGNSGSSSSASSDDSCMTYTEASDSGSDSGSDSDSD